jgi:phosphoenolpyruvate synthase/pyruvate phosphate dikinase
MEYLLRLLADDFRKGDDVGIQLEHAKNRHKEIEQEKKSLANKLDLDEKLRYLFTVSSELMYMKDWRKGAYQRSYVVMDKVIGEIAKRMDISLKEAKYIVIDEISEAFAGNGLDKLRTKAKARAKLCCYKIIGNKMEIWDGEECKKIVNEMMETEGLQNDDGKDQIIKGMVAYKGHVKGVAKIVLVEADMEKLNEGEILVSSATNPDLILAMKRASAFVTDMGGITSHAAIVSREMKKPCVVGTKNATRLIKDGDMVEVNADLGIVTIIK